LKILLSIPDYNLINGVPELIPWCKAFFLNKAFIEQGHKIEIHYSSLFDEKQRIKILRQIQKYKIGSVPIHLVQKIIDKQLFKSSSNTLLQHAKYFSPNLIIFHDKTFFNKAILKKLKDSADAKLILMIGTSPITLPNYIQNTAPFFDYVFSSDYYHSITWQELGAKKSHCLPISACDRDYHKPYKFVNEYEKINFEYDISFVGRLHSDLYADRRRYLTNLCKKFNVAIYSPDYETIDNYPILKKNYKGTAHREKMIKAISASKISLNFHGQTVQSGGNLKLFEIPATNTLQIVDRYNSNWFQEGKEIVSFDDLNDLIKKIEYYLDNEVDRKKIAKAGQIRVYEQHTYAKRMEKMLKIIYDT
tara:strand:- start:1898 stop:2983 length:1086 start_codon:yes stop_codon:yes gene_type:complete